MELINALLQFIRNLEPTLLDWTSWMGPWFYVAMFVVIFAETGLVVTPFLPGDSLLFVLGALAARPDSPLNLLLLFVLLSLAAVLGDAVNYAIGWWFGPAVFRSEKSMLFNRKHLWRAQNFYEKYGSKTIILARFVPIIRTFAPFVAGIGKMFYPRFALYNVIGGIAWVGICLGAGWFLGQNEFVKKRFELVVLGIIFVSVLPMLVEMLLAWRKKPETVAMTPPANQP